MATNGYIHYSNVAILPDKNETANTTFSEVLGNKTDDAANTANTSSIVALLRYVIANLSSDTDVSALIGALNTVAHTGAADDITTAMGYLKQLITDLRTQLADGGDASAATLGSLYGILGNPATSISTDLAAVKAVTDLIPDAGAMTSIAQDLTVAKEVTLGVPVVTIAGDIAALDLKVGTPVVDLATDIAALATLLGVPIVDFITDLNNLIGVPVVSISTDIASLDTKLGTPVGADFSVDIAAIKTVSDNIYGVVDSEIASIKAETDQIGAIANSGGTATLSAILGDFTNTTLISKFDVSTADVISNDTVAQVIGNKTDTTATNGVSGTKSLMAYTKQLVAEGIVRDAKILAGIPQMITVDTPDASTTNWTQAAHRLFTVTGVAMVRVFGVISETLVGAGTLAVGVAGATAGCIATVADATTLATGDILANSGTATLIPLGQTNEYAIVSGTDIDLTVGTADITDGAITFYCQWLPVSVGATVTAAIWD